SSSIVATGHDLRWQRVAMPVVGDRRTGLGQGCGGVRCAGVGDWGDRLSGRGNRFKKQAASKNGRLGNQRTCARQRDALRRKSGLSAGPFLREIAGAIRKQRQGSSTERALLSRSKKE